MPARQCENERRKKNGAIVLAWSVPYSITCGSLLNRAIRVGAAKKKITPIISARIVEIAIPK